jgi:ribosome maturation factor RimP
MSGFLNDIRKLAEQVSAREGCYLYDLELTGTGGGRVLRVTIEKDAEGGVSVDDCTNVSRGLNLLLDVEDVVPGGNYNLEVSSPGLERPLKEARHYQMAIGKKISVKTFAPLLQFNEQFPQLGKAKQIQSKLLSFDDKGLKLALNAGANDGANEQTGDGAEAAVGSPAAAVDEVFIPFETITKAHVVFEFANPQANKPGKGPKKGKANKR